MKKVESPVGFKPFYCLTEDNGAIYHFYDKDGNELRHSLEDLKKCTSFKIEGTPSKDKWFFYQTLSYAEEPLYCYPNAWGPDRTCGTNRTEDILVGKGKKNTEKLMALNFLKNEDDIFTDIEDYEHSLSNEEKKKLPLKNRMGWYVPSANEAKALYDYLDAHGLEEPSLKIWTSCEHSPTEAIAISLLDGSGYAIPKRRIKDDVRAVYIFSI